MAEASRSELLLCPCRWMVLEEQEGGRTAASTHVRSHRVLHGSEDIPGRLLGLMGHLEEVFEMCKGGAVAGTNKSLFWDIRGFGSVSNELMLSMTLKRDSAGLHWLFKTSMQMAPFGAIFI